MYQTRTLNPSVSSRQASQPSRTLQPLPLRSALPLFFVPALVVALGFYLVRPAFQALDIPPFKSFLAAMTLSLSMVFTAAIVAYNKVEGQPLTWQAFGERMRFPRLRFKDLLLGVGLFILANIGYGLFSGLGMALIQAGLIPVPDGIPAVIDPRVSFDISALHQLAGGSLRGQWELVALFVVMFFFNIVGEELWWRGYILPRQELAHGRRTWLVHGLLWTLFHFYKWWDMLGLLPVCLILSGAAQKAKNNWPVLIAHALTNGMILVLLVAGAAGWI